VSKPRWAGAHTDQRLNLSKLWEGPRKKCQGFKPDPGNPAVRDYRGASGNVSHGGNVHRPAIERAGNGNPPPTAGRARFLSQSVRADFTQRLATAFATGHRKGVRTCLMPTGSPRRGALSASMQPKWPIAGIETPTPPPSSGTGAKSAKIVNRHGPTALLRPTGGRVSQSVQ
jgi:hypothetical protein